jgi:RNA polymerase sigma-70 factor (ECF subfamily)
VAFSRRAEHARLGLVNGAPAVLVTPQGRLVTAIAFTITNGRIVTIDIIADPERLNRLTIESSEPAGDHR